MKVFLFEDSNEKSSYVVAENLLVARNKHALFSQSQVTDKPTVLNRISDTGVDIEKIIENSEKQAKAKYQIYSVELEWTETDCDAEEIELTTTISKYIIADNIDEVIDYAAGEYGFNHIKCVGLWCDETDQVIF